MHGGARLLIDSTPPLVGGGSAPPLCVRALGATKYSRNIRADSELRLGEDTRGDGVRGPGAGRAFGQALVKQAPRAAADPAAAVALSNKI